MDDSPIYDRGESLEQFRRGRERHRPPGCPVGLTTHAPARFEDEQAAGGVIPRVQPPLEVRVEPAGRDEREIE